jgi:hypothetical protein
MLQQEKDKLEERIVAYFEGSLDQQSSRSLLSEVGTSTESRGLFKAHESLSRLISAARVPLETPIEVKRSIVERIPGLLAFIPGLLGGAQALPILSQSASPLWSFFAKIPLSTAISVGTSVAVLTTAGVVIKNKLDDNAASEHKARVAVVQNQAKRADAPQYYMAPLPSRDAAAPEVGHAGSVVAEARATSNRSQQVSGHTPANRTDQADLSDRSHRTNESHATDRPAADIVADHAGVLPATNDVDKGVTPLESTPKLNESANPPSASLPPQESSQDISTVTPQSSGPAQANIILPRASVLTPLPMSFGDGSVVRPFGSIGTRVSFFQVNGEAAPNTHKSATSIPVLSFLAGLDFLLDESFSLRLQGGQSTFAHEVLRGELQPGPGSIPNYISYSTVETDAAYWATGGLNYQFNLTETIPVILSAGTGAAWLHPIAFMADFGASAEIPISSSFALRPGVTFDALWTGIDGLRDGTTLPASAIFVNRQLSGSGFVSTSLGINVGFVVRY